MKNMKKEKNRNRFRFITKSANFDQITNKMVKKHALIKYS